MHACTGARPRLQGPDDGLAAVAGGRGRLRRADDRGLALAAAVVLLAGVGRKAAEQRAQPLAPGHVRLQRRIGRAAVVQRRWLLLCAALRDLRGGEGLVWLLGCVRPDQNVSGSREMNPERLPQSNVGSSGDTHLCDDRFFGCVVVVFGRCAVISDIYGFLVDVGYLATFRQLQQAVPRICAAAHHLSFLPVLHQPAAP